MVKEGIFLIQDSIFPLAADMIVLADFYKQKSLESLPIFESTISRIIEDTKNTTSFKTSDSDLDKLISKLANFYSSDLFSDPFPYSLGLNPDEESLQLNVYFAAIKEFEHKLDRISYFSGLLNKDPSVCKEKYDSFMNDKEERDKVKYNSLVRAISSTFENNMENLGVLYFVNEYLKQGSDPDKLGKLNTVKTNMHWPFIKAISDIVSDKKFGSFYNIGFKPTEEKTGFMAYEFPTITRWFDGIEQIYNDTPKPRSVPNCVRYITLFGEN